MIVSIFEPGHDYAVGWHDWGYGQPLRVSTLGARVASLSACPSKRGPKGVRARFFDQRLLARVPTSSRSLARVPANPHEVAAECTYTGMWQRGRLHLAVNQAPKDTVVRIHPSPPYNPSSMARVSTKPELDGEGFNQTRARWRGFQQPHEVAASSLASSSTHSERFETRTRSLPSAPTFFAWMAEWLKAADCKPADESPRQFESGSMLQQLSLHRWRNG